MKPFVRKKSFELEEYDVHNPYIYTEYIEAIYIATFILFINPECFRFLNKHIQRINSLHAYLFKFACAFFEVLTNSLMKNSTKPKHFIRTI